MSSERMRQGGEILAFRQLAVRRRRPESAGGGEERGTVLLFTGVRYARMPEAVGAADRISATDQRIGA